METGGMEPSASPTDMSAAPIASVHTTEATSPDTGPDAPETKSDDVVSPAAPGVSWDDSVATRARKSTNSSTLPTHPGPPATAAAQAQANRRKSAMVRYGHSRLGSQCDLAAPAVAWDTMRRQQRRPSRRHERRSSSVDSLFGLVVIVCVATAACMRLRLRLRLHNRPRHRTTRSTESFVASTRNMCRCD